MDHNQLKLKILGLFRPTLEYESAQVLSMLSNESGSKHTNKAIEMALLRYWRQGLFKRTRRQGRFYYSLTEKGQARKEWLLKTTGPSEA